MDNQRPVVRIKSAWLLTWEWMGDSASVVDHVAGILNYRRSQKRVIDVVEFLYNLHISNLSELAAYAKNRKNVPRKAEVDFNGRIKCGSHPFLYARQVQNIEVHVDPDSGIETIFWETFPTYEPTEDGPRLAMESRREGFTRLITGPLSFESLWDRESNRIKAEYHRQK